MSEQEFDQLYEALAQTQLLHRKHLHQLYVATRALAKITEANYLARSQEIAHQALNEIGEARRSKLCNK
jgi:hypothetical protein